MVPPNGIGWVANVCLLNKFFKQEYLTIVIYYLRSQEKVLCFLKMVGIFETQISFMLNRKINNALSIITVIVVVIIIPALHGGGIC